VACEAHVVMTEEDVRLLELCDTLLNKGMILVALNSMEGAVEQSNTLDTQEEAAAAVERISARIQHQTVVTDILCGSTVSRQLGASPVQHLMTNEMEHTIAMSSSSKEVLAAADEALARVMIVQEAQEEEEEGVEADLEEHEQLIEEEPAMNAVDLTDLTEVEQEQEPIVQEQESEVSAESKNAALDTTSELIVDVTPKDEEKKEEDEGLGEYSVRRDIATKVLGAKMLQGYVLKETCCTKCGMPLMEYAGELDCVVCPVLVKKAKKKLKAERLVATNEANQVNDELLQQAQEERRRELQFEEEERMRMEEMALEEAQRSEQERLLQEEAKQLEVARLAEAERIAEEEAIAEAKRVAEEESVDQLLRNQLARLEEARLLQEQLVQDAMVDAQIRMQEEAERLESEAVAEKIAQEEYEEAVAMELQAQEEQRRKQDELVLLETRRLEVMEQALVSGERGMQNAGDRSVHSAGSEMWDMQIRETERQRLEKQMAVVKAAEEARVEAELEARREAEEKRMNEESNLIAVLEEEANRKTKAAEEAIARAKVALEEVSSAKRHIIACTIAQAEAEAIAEAESIVMADAEGFIQPPDILLSASCLQNERWELLRSEARSVMTRRMMQGWTMAADMCHGEECQSAPLLKKGAVTVCAVCGGSGSGADGVYDRGFDEDASDDEDDENFASENQETSFILPADQPSTPKHDDHDSELVQRTLSPTANLSVDKIKEDFDTKRNLVSKEIGKKMMQGWTLLDGSCPTCVMPLMTDGEGGPDTCVLCGPLPLAEVLTAPHPSSEESTQRSLPVAEVLTAPHPSSEESTQRSGDLKEIPKLIIEQEIEPFQSDAPAHMSTIDGLAQRPSTPRSDPPAMTVDDEDTYSKAPEPDCKVEIEPLNDEPAEEESGVKSDLSIATRHDNGEITFTLPFDFDPSNEAAVRELLLQLSLSKSNLPSTNENMDNALASGTAVVHARTIDCSDEVSHITTGATSFAKPPKPEFSPRAVAPRVVTTTSTIQDDEIVALERELNLHVPTPKISNHPNPMDMSMGRKLPSLPPRPMGARSRSNSVEKYSISGGPPSSPLTPGKSNRHSHNVSGSPNQRSSHSPSWRKGPPKPDDDSPSRSLGVSRTSSANSLRSLRIPPLSPKVAGRHGSTQTPQVVGGPRDDVSVMSDGGHSRAESVATDALSAILDRIEDCKSTLQSSHDIMEQVEMANLIEKLASAAVGLKKLEEMGV